LRPRAERAVGPQQIYIGFIPDRRAFVTYSFQMERPDCGPVSFWEANSGRRIEWFDADERIGTTALSPNGAWLAVSHGRKELCDKFQLFDTATGRVRSDLPIEEGIYPLRPCFSPDSRWFAFCEVHNDGDRVQLWDINAGRLCRTFRPTLVRSKLTSEKFEPAFRLAFSPGGSLLAIAEDACEPPEAWPPGRSATARAAC
jgi:Tol biopolymer transport system component